MPLISGSKFKRPGLLINGHLETIVPNTLRKVDHVDYSRERFTTADQDFFLLDWIKQGADKLVVLTHGLEGHSEKPYMKGLARIFSRRGWDVLAWNCRSCGGEMNNQLKLYHHGDIADLNELVNYLNEKYSYRKIALAGVSMGGSIILKYLGEMENSLPNNVKGAVAISTPCDLAASERMLRKPVNAIYRRRFFKKLWQKTLIKSQQFLPEAIQQLKRARTFSDLHRWFTMPVYGFKSEDEFYQQGSAKNFLHRIKVPSLILNALNDPMLADDCYPVKIAEQLEHVFLEIPRFGGHAGFMQKGEGPCWSELRASAFINSL